MKINARIVDVAVNPNSIPPDLSICQSDIPEGGNGLFANKLFNAGAVICEYKGTFVLENEKREDMEYVLQIGHPSMETLGGERIIAIDANPELNHEIGYGGFANDINAEYGKELRKLGEAHMNYPKGDPAFRKTMFEKFKKNPNYKLTPKEKKKAKKLFGRNKGVRMESVRKIYVEHGYNAVFSRLNGAASFVLIAIRVIYPGEEIYVPYGPEYWDAKKK